jgi:hypothetical protein
MSRIGLACLPLWCGVLTAAQHGTTPKASEQDYPAHAAVGDLSIGAEYLVHSFAGAGETFIAKDYLVVEVALFPARGKPLAVNAGQFSLRINQQKQALTPQGPEFVAASLKFPDWETHPHTEASGGPVIFGAPPPVERFPGDPRARRVPPPPKAPEDNPSGLEKEPPVKADELAIQAALPEGEQRGPVKRLPVLPL